MTLPALVALTVLAPTQAPAQGDSRPDPRPQLLSRAGHGSAVIAALGDRLPAAARANEMSPTALKEVLREDPSAWIGPDGQMFYVEKADPQAAEAATAGTEPTAAAAASYPTSQTFSLHSRPSSTHTIFLDFDGATVSGTWWNAKRGMPAQFYTGFTLDGDPSTFTANEHTYIQQVWQIVSEKYAPFDVDITTEDPGPAGYNRSSAADAYFGDHVIITNNSTAVNTACGGSCSGIALLNTFDDTWYTDSYLEPAWVFSSKTSGSAVLTAYTVAHEVGHTFGLNHDGDASHEYSSGHANWFPLMGSSAKAVGQFSKGEYSGANNTQDDVTVIASHGAPILADDHSDQPTGATAVATGAVADGVIGTRNDRDVFAVDHDCTTNLIASAKGIGPGASLDMSVTVLGPDGGVLGTNDPVSGQNSTVWPAVPTGMDAKVSVPAGNGTYYVRVDGVGKANPATDGYSDYDSMGYYQLAIGGCDGTMPTTTITIGSTASPTKTTITARAPSAPRIGLARSGRRGGPVNATARWSAPVSTGGAPVLGYRVVAKRLDSSGRVVKSVRSAVQSSGTRGLRMKLAKGRYRFVVLAYNQAGWSPASSTSRTVRAR